MIYRWCMFLIVMRVYASTMNTCTMDTCLLQHVRVFVNNTCFVRRMSCVFIASIQFNEYESRVNVVEKKSMEHSFIQTDWVKERFDWISNDMTIDSVQVEMIWYFIVYNHYDYHLACCYKYELLTIDIFIRRIDFQFYGFCFSWTFHLSLYLCFLFWFVRTERTRVRFDILIHRREWIGSIVVETLCFSL